MRASGRIFWRTSAGFRRGRCSARCNPIAWPSFRATLPPASRLPRSQFRSRWRRRGSAVLPPRSASLPSWPARWHSRLFGANRFLSSGANSTITPIFAGGLALVAAAGSPAYAALAAMLALMVGTMLVAGGIFRLGWIADLLSVPVTIGFLVGIAAHILVSQLPDVLGLPSPDGPMLGRVAMLTRHVGEANPLTVAIALGVLLVVIGAERIAERIPGALIGLAAATIVTVLLGLESRGVAVLGVVAGGLPKLAFPEVTVGQWVRLLPLGFIIALVVMVQTAATTRSFPSLPGEAPDVDADFVGVGAGSILAGLFGAFAVNASPPRTAIVAATADAPSSPASWPRLSYWPWRRSGLLCCATFPRRRLPACCSLLPLGSSNSARSS